MPELLGNNKTVDHCVWSNNPKIVILCLEQ